MTVERDFGTPNDLRDLVNEAHRRGIAVVLDQVFNHTSNTFNPLWKMILEHPLEEGRGDEGGLYFSGGTPWGNRIATEKTDVQNMLIDACKLWLREYHVDGFRFDATHTYWMDHGFLHRLADELKGFDARSLLIAENLPNEPDLNRQGYDGYTQWCDPYHDRLKALLREGEFQGTFNSMEGLGDVFFFSKSIFASHTNNALNYTESHDETSISYEVGTNPVLNNGGAKERKGRLGMFATIAALGQPMIYQGQEFNPERDRNVVSFDWPSPPENNGFYQWAWRLIHLRRRYPGLKLSGYNPAEQGQFDWILGPWMDGAHGGGQRVLGWRSRPNFEAFDNLVVLLNFENHDVTVDLELGQPGTWVKLADVERVNDVAPVGSNSPFDPTAVRSNDGRFGGFTLPSSSGFIYKWETP
jgi:1,4-alpha-glucan branching enzyme